MGNGDATPPIGSLRRTDAGEVQRWDGREWVPDTADRDDAGRAVAGLWGQRHEGPACLHGLPLELIGALDRLAAAYGIRTRPVTTGFAYYLDGPLDGWRSEVPLPYPSMLSPEIPAEVRIRWPGEPRPIYRLSSLGFNGAGYRTGPAPVGENDP